MPSRMRPLSRSSLDVTWRYSDMASTPSRAPSWRIVQPSKPSRAEPFVSLQRAGRIIGVLFLLTFLTSIGAYALYGSVLDDRGWVVGGQKQMSSTGALLSFPEMIWEGGVLGVYLIVKGFRDPAVTTEEPVVSASLPARAAR
jgi:hypothetical protein